MTASAVEAMPLAAGDYWAQVPEDMSNGDAALDAGLHSWFKAEHFLDPNFDADTYVGELRRYVSCPPSTTSSWFYGFYITPAPFCPLMPFRLHFLRPRGVLWTSEMDCCGEGPGLAHLFPLPPCGRFHWRP